MKKTSLKLISVLSIALLLSGCGLTSMMSKFNTIQYTVTPSNLEVHGGEVDAPDLGNQCTDLLVIRVVEEGKEHTVFVD